MSHHEQERENTMKKQLIIAFAICVLFLSACSSLVGTSTLSTNVAAHSTAPSACSALEESQTKLEQEYRAASAQLTATRAWGNPQQVGEAKMRLIRLHQGIAWVQSLIAREGHCSG